MGVQSCSLKILQCLPQIPHPQEGGNNPTPRVVLRIEIIHVKCLVSVQEAPSVICSYCTEEGTLMPWFREEEGPSWVMQQGQEDERQKKEKRGFEAPGTVVSCAQCTWRSCSEERRVVGSKAGKVSWDQMAGV